MIGRYLTIILSLMLIVTPVTAGIIYETLVEDQSPSQTISKKYAPLASSATYPTYPGKIVIETPVTLSGNQFSISVHAKISTNNSTVMQNNIAVELRDSSGSPAGSGKLSYVKLHDGTGLVMLTISEFTSTLTETQIYDLYDLWGTALESSTNSLDCLTMYRTGHYYHKDYPGFVAAFGASSDSRFFANGEYTIQVTTPIVQKNYIQVLDDPDPQYNLISIERVIEGTPSPSRIRISGVNETSGEKVVYIDNTHVSDPFIIRVPVRERPHLAEIFFTQIGRWITVYLAEDAPPPSVDLYGDVIDVYTGVPISGATITASQPTIGRTIQIVSDSNGTYSSGLTAIGLLPDVPVIISATATGYETAYLSYQAVPPYPEWYVPILMVPNTAPDIPIEEGKSMLYGYAITQGSQQPISGATVSLDGNGSTTTSSTGFYLFNNVTPGTYDISASAPLHDALSEPVTVDSAPTQHNLALKGHYSLTITVKDGDTLANVQNATISLSDGQESTQNPATFTADYGPYTITAAAGGYYPQTQSAYLDKPGTTTATVLLTAKPEPTPAPEYPNYPQHNVRFLCVDEYNHPLQNVTITAVYQESSGPVSWITDWLGLSQNVHVANSTLQGTTGLDGSAIFLMVQSVQYRMTVAAPAPLNMTKTFDLYPKEDQITIRFVTSPGPDLSTMPAYDLTATEINASAVRLALSYHDTTNATTSLTFNVYDHATGDVIHTETFAASSFPGTVSPSYTVENTKGAMYRFGFEATNTAHGPISQYTGITLKGDNLLVDLGFEDRTLYQWLAVILLFLFAGAFSGTNVKQGAILVPAFGGGLFWFIGWLPASIGGVISAIGFLGVLVYMRKSEWKVRA